MLFIPLLTHFMQQRPMRNGIGKSERRSNKGDDRRRRNRQLGGSGSVHGHKLRAEVYGETGQNQIYDGDAEERDRGSEAAFFLSVESADSFDEHDERQNEYGDLRALRQNGTDIGRVEILGHRSRAVGRECGRNHTVYIKEAQSARKACCTGAGNERDCGSLRERRREGRKEDPDERADKIGDRPFFDEIFSERHGLEGEVQPEEYAAEHDSRRRRVAETNRNLYGRAR